MKEGSQRIMWMSICSHCQRCKQQVYECEYMYIFQFHIEYDTDKVNVTAFQDVVEQIIGVPTLQLYEYGYQGNTKETTNIFENYSSILTYSN